MSTFYSFFKRTVLFEKQMRELYVSVRKFHSSRYENGRGSSRQFVVGCKDFSLNGKGLKVRNKLLWRIESSGDNSSVFLSDWEHVHYLNSHKVSNDISRNSDDNNNKVNAPVTEGANEVSGHVQYIGKVWHLISGGM